MRPLNRAFILCSTVAVIGLMSSPARADEMYIRSAHPYVSSGVMDIDGSGFKAGIRVWLDFSELQVMSVTDSKVKVKLPKVSNGTYRLILDHKRDRPHSFIVYVGTSDGSGTPGPAGPQGPAGPAGPPGLSGPIGPQGPVGPRGADGATGATGAVGPAGSVGPAGPSGPTGATGNAGPAGAIGPSGATGPAGPQGAQGLQGLQGPAGSGVSVRASGGVVGAVSGAAGGSTVVIRQENGVWLAIHLDALNVVPMSFGWAFYTDNACSSPAYTLIDTPFRVVQTVNRGDATGYYAGDPAAPHTFLGLKPLGQPSAACTPIDPDPMNADPNLGWMGPYLSGPLTTIDLSGFQGPYTIQ